ncbi:Dihydroneopterin aldolase [uncultured archaeon]|nr:Dihydroneopterin aldolase [uncultured archaeon]
MKTAVLKIRGLKAHTLVGVKKSERKKKQKLVINVRLEYDATKAIKTDDVKYAVDYDALSKRITKEVEKTRFYLIEKLADHILSVIMEDKRVLEAKVKVSKPGALPSAKSVNAELSAKRPARKSG